MKIVYMPRHLFGDFYIDPTSNKGVAMTDTIDPVIIGMSPDYDPYSEPNAVEYDISEAAFQELLRIGERRHRSEFVEFRQKHFL
jgi:hypothetical protein